VPFQDSFLALTDTGSLRPVHITVGVRFFRVGQHLARVPLSSWPLYSRINSPSRLSLDHIEPDLEGQAVILLIRLFYSGNHQAP